MPAETNSEISRAFVQLGKRAESADRATLVQTFVDIGTLLPSISTRDHQIIFGRRGTGKTHALIYVLEKAAERGALAIYVDLRTVGSSGGIYSDSRLTLSERATRLLLDVLAYIHEAIFSTALANPQADLSTLGPLLDALGSAITEVRVEGGVTRQRQDSINSSQENTSGITITASPKPTASIANSDKRAAATASAETFTETGSMAYRVHFGSVAKAVRDLVSALPLPEMILVLDEWVAIPTELQPYLADLLRRALFPVNGITVKIAAIEQRSLFKLKGEGRDYIGIEVGADASTDVNLDDFMVFENDAEKAIQFLRDLVYKHYKAEVPNSQITSQNELIRLAFTQNNSFEEFVRSAEGVPRDAINILSVSAQKATDEKISILHVRAAARNWYLRGKEATVNSDPEAQRLLHWIIDQVIGKRKARAFLLLSGTQHPLIDTLFDDRVLHLMKRGIAAKDQPGIRYDVYKIDYGAYVDLITTDRAPRGLLPLDEEANQFVDVPPDDYRAIRRAILSLDSFDATKLLPLAATSS